MSVQVVACVLLSEDNHVVMGRRVDNGLFEVPGGKVEVGEDIYEAFRRELLEETGLAMPEEVQPVYIGSFEGSYDSSGFVVHYLLTRDWKDFPRRMEPEKSLGWHWLPVTGLPPLEECSGSSSCFVCEFPLFVEGEMTFIGSDLMGVVS